MDVGQQLIVAADKSLGEVQALVENNSDIDVNYADKYGETPLMNASRSGRDDIAQYLLEKNADINLRFLDKGGWTPLMFAGYFGHLSLVQLLVLNGADPKLETNKGESVLNTVPCMNVTQEEVINALNRGLQERGDNETMVFEEGSFSPKNEERFERITANADTVESLVRFQDLYQGTCGDFEQKPEGTILKQVTMMIEREIPCDILMLSGRRVANGADKNPEQLTDPQIFPLLEVLGHAFPNSPFVTIDLSFNTIKNQGAKAIAVYLTQTLSLERLNLRGNNISEVGASKIAQALYGQSTLKHLDLSCNPIGDEGVSKIAETLLGNNSLTSLNIGNTDMGQVALVKIATALNINETLANLNLTSPLLFSKQEETTISIAKALGTNTTLKSLSLAKHNLQDHGAGWLSEYLALNRTITSLDLSCNKITQTAVAEFARMMGTRETPLKINLNSNNLNRRDMDEILESIEEGSKSAINTVKYNSTDEIHSLVSA